MKIGIDIRTLMDKEPSGVSEHTLGLVREIIEQDSENEYVLFYNSFKNIDDRISEFTRNVSFGELHAKGLAGRTNNVEIVKTSYPNKIFNIIMQLGLRWPKLDKLLAVDVFLMPNPGFFALSNDVKKILVIHDLSFLRHREFFNLKRLIWHRIINVKKQIKNADKIIAVSENTKNDIIELCKIKEDKIEVIYPGINKEFKVLEKDNKEIKAVKEKYNLSDNFILYLGTIEPRKNIIGIIRAYEIFRENNNNFKNYKLVIAGAKGWKYNKIYKEWEKSKYKKDIKFLGYVEKEEKVHLYNLASIFLYPSFFEGFGFPPLEAMASGAAVIASNSSSLGEVLGDANIAVNPYNIKEIAKSIEILMKNDGLKHKIIQKGLERSRRYRWAKTADKHINIFKMKKQ